MEKNFKYYRNIFLTLIFSYIAIKSIENFKDFAPLVEFLLDVLAPFMMGCLLAYILNPVVKMIENKLKIKRIFSLFISYMLVIIVFVLFATLIAPVLIGNIAEISSQIPFYFEKTQNFVINTLKDINDFNPTIFTEVEAQFKAYLPQIGNIVLSSATQILNSTVSLFGSIVDAIMSVIISFYLLMEKESIMQFVKKTLLVAFNKKYNFIIEFITTLNNNIGVYVSSKMLDSCIVGLISTVVLFLIGSKYSLLLGIIMIFCNLIPYFGPILGMIPAIIINLFYNPMVSLYALIALLIVQQIEMIIIEPKIVGGQLGLNPLLTLLSISIGGALFGVAGMIMSTPIMGVLKIYISQHLDYKYSKIIDETEIV